MNILFKKFIIFIFTTIFSTVVSASADGPRMYWNAPVGMNILQTYAWFISGNQAVTSGAQYNPDISADINLALVGYNYAYDVSGHSALFSAVITAGNISGEFLNISQSERGLGDLYLQSTFNIFGAPALSYEEFATYKQKTILSLLLGVNMPTGDYDINSDLNMGANRWAVRVGLPFVQTLGDWKPGEITTLEILPSVWYYGDNDDYGALSQKLEQDPLYVIEAHLTRDITPAFYVSLDYLYQTGGETTLNDIKNNDSQNIDSLGATFGHMINEQLQFLFRYSATLSPANDELDADNIQFDFLYYW